MSLLIHPLPGRVNCAKLRGGDAEALGSNVTCPRSHSQQVGGGLQPRASGPRIRSWVPSSSTSTGSVKRPSEPSAPAAPPPHLPPDWMQPPLRPHPTLASPNTQQMLMKIRKRIPVRSKLNVHAESLQRALWSDPTPKIDAPELLCRWQRILRTEH